MRAKNCVSRLQVMETAGGSIILPLTLGHKMKAAFYELKQRWNEMVINGRI